MKSNNLKRCNFYDTTTQLQIKLVSIWERGLLVESQLSEIQNYWEGIRYTTGQELILDLNFKWHIMIKLKAFYGRKNNNLGIIYDLII
jgi:hypothetical protein